MLFWTGADEDRARGFQKAVCARVQGTQVSARMVADRLPNQGSSKAQISHQNGKKRVA
jgi:hypothetical protein